MTSILSRLGSVSDEQQVAQEVKEALRFDGQMTISSLYGTVRVFGINGRWFVYGNDGDDFVQEFDRRSGTLSRKLYANPQASRFGSTPQDDLAERVRKKVENRQRL